VLLGEGLANTNIYTWTLEMSCSNVALSLLQVYYYILVQVFQCVSAITKSTQISIMETSLYPV
jgi:hypothetical protein